MKQFAGQPAAGNPLVTTVSDKLALVKTVPDARREALRAQAERTVADQIYPAWQRATAFLESLVPRANDDAGLWRLNGGADAYAYNLRRYTSTDLTADEIHEIGLKQVARIEADMDGLLRQLGRTQGSVKDRIEQLKKDRAYPLTDEGRAQIMADVERILRDAEQRSGALFDHRPAAPVRAQPFPRFRENNAAANYTAPAPDGSRPGVFQIPLRPSNMTRFGLRTLVYHETVPAITSRLRSKWKTPTNRGFGESVRSAAFPRSAKAGGCTPSGPPRNQAGTRAISRDASVNSTPSSFARGASSWIRAFTPSIGRDSRALTTASSRAKWSATLSIRDRPARTCSAS
jgi:hypothetical protein